MIFCEFLPIRYVWPKLDKFIYDNVWQSVTRNRSEKGKIKWFQTCSSRDACSELTHLSQSHNRVNWIFLWTLSHKLYLAQTCQNRLQQFLAICCTELIKTRKKKVILNMQWWHLLNCLIWKSKNLKSSYALLS